MSFKLALDRLGDMTVTGVTRKFGLDDTIQGEISPADLPALIVTFGEGQGRGFVPFDVGGVAGRATMRVRHVLAYTLPGLGRSQDRFYGMAAIIDNYFSAIADDWTLNDNLLERLSISVPLPGTVIIANTGYIGCYFDHTWVLRLT